MILVHAAILVISPMLNIFQHLLTPILFWPRFYLNLFGPGSDGRSIYEILFQSHAPPSRLNLHAKLKNNFDSKSNKIYRADFYIHSELQADGHNMHITEQPNKSMVEAVTKASLPISNPFWLLTLHTYLRSKLPTLPQDHIMALLAGIGILLVYSYATVRGIYYLTKQKIGSIFRKSKQTILVPGQTGKKRRQNRSQSRAKLRHLRPNQKSTSEPPNYPHLHIKIFATNKDSTSPENFSFDTDGLPFIIDNSATGAICNEKSLFMPDLKPHNVSVETASGIETKVKQVGTLRLELVDDNGIKYSYDLPGVVYDPDSPYSILGIPFLSEFFAKKDGNATYDEGTWILTRATHSHFTWDHGKCERHFRHGQSLLPELWLYQGTSYWKSFCTRIKGFLDDKVSYAFSSAFSVEPSHETDGQDDTPVVSQDDISVNEGDEEDEYMEKWYTPPQPPMQVGHRPKRVRFAKETKSPTTSPEPPRNSDFELGMNLVYKDGKGNSEAVVYEGESANGLNHIIRRKDGTKLLVPDSNLELLHQMSLSNLPQTPLDYCREVGKGLTKEEAQRLARPRTLTPLQQELMSWHHRLYHLPFRHILMLAKLGILPKRLLECKDKLPLCVACQFGCAHRRPWRKGKKKGSIRKKDQTVPGDATSMDQIVSSQPGIIPQMPGFLTSNRI